MATQGKSRRRHSHKQGHRKQRDHSQQRQQSADPAKLYHRPEAQPNHPNTKAPIFSIIDPRRIKAYLDMIYTVIRLVHQFAPPVHHDQRHIAVHVLVNISISVSVTVLRFLSTRHRKTGD